MDYTDVSAGSVTPDVTCGSFNPFGQPRSITGGAGSHICTYDDTYEGAIHRSGHFSLYFRCGEVHKALMPRQVRVQYSGAI
jgi:hypothetical protein